RPGGEQKPRSGGSYPSGGQRPDGDAGGAQAGADRPAGAGGWSRGGPGTGPRARRGDGDQGPRAAAGARPGGGRGTLRGAGGPARAGSYRSEPGRAGGPVGRRPAGDRRSGPGGERRAAEHRPTPTTRPRAEAPPLPEEARPELLDLEIRKELRGLPIGLAEVVSRHLVAAAMLLDDDPALALAHARTAASLAARLPATREAAGIAAYHAGEYATALVELRTARRMDGSPRYLPMIADAERGLGRPERAIAYLTDPSADALDPAGRAELLIVGSGARRDLGQPEAAVVLLQEEATRPGEPRPWTARLRYAYAEALLDAGRPADALRAFESAAAIDAEGETDADERVYELMTQLAAEPAAEPAAVSVAPAAEAGRAPGDSPLPGATAPTVPERAGEEPAAEEVRDEARPEEEGPGQQEESAALAGGSKRVTPVLFDDGSSSLALIEAGQAAEAPEEPARRQSSAPALPDLSVLFSDLGLREIPEAERRSLTPDATDDGVDGDDAVEGAVDIVEIAADEDEDDIVEVDADDDGPEAGKG
ncbi:tetratricopeptide repeat protein, partial [Frankia nepalensis]|uniref:tetratricopeptide repeat protein n=1 Tax=Frankia nepalensis TaxID=1836974 RepID=UPI001EE3D923